MADDETIVIRVNAAQGEAALAALGAAGIKAGADIKSVESATAGSTDKLAAFGAKLFGLTKIAGTFGEVVRQAASHIEFESDAAKEATKSTADLFTAIGSLDAPGVGAALGRIIGNLEAMRQGLDETTVKLGEMADAGKAEKFAELLKAQREITENQKAQVAALNASSEALSREIEAQERSGKVQVHLKDLLKEKLDAYYKERSEIPPILQEQADRLGVLSTAQEKARDTAVDAANKELESRAKVLASLEGDSKEREHSTKVLLEAITAVESHGDVTQEQSAKIQAAVLAETKLYTDYGAVVPAQLQLVIDKYKVLAEQQAKTIKDAEERLSKALSKAGKIDSSQDTSEIEQNLAGINREIKELEGSAIIDAGQQQRLDELKNSALDLQRSMGDLNRAFTVTNESFLTEEEAIEGANAALDVAIAYNEKVRRGMNALQSSTGKAADSFEDLADGAKKATEDGAEGVDKLKEGLQEAMPLAKEFLSIIREIKSEAAGIDF